MHAEKMDDAMEEKKMKNKKTSSRGNEWEEVESNVISTEWFFSPIIIAWTVFSLFYTFFFVFYKPP